jgi:predicted regulator of Ras-like GTPase activity (Roadblock/LC7/MglB family)
MATAPMSELPHAAPTGRPAGPGGQDDLSGVSRQVRQPGPAGPGRPRPARPGGFQQKFDPNLSEFIIDEAVSTAANAVLSRLIQASHASSGMVLDRAGQIIVYGGQEYRTEMMMLGALIAGTYASTREMARILREENFRMLLQEGAKEKIFTEAVGDYWLVSIIFDRNTHLGLVKVLCSRATADLNEILNGAIEANRNRPRQRDAGLARVTKDTIDLIFRDESGT